MPTFFTWSNEASATVHCQTAESAAAELVERMRDRAWMLGGAIYVSERGFDQLADLVVPTATVREWLEAAK